MPNPKVKILVVYNNGQRETFTDADGFSTEVEDGAPVGGAVMSYNGRNIRVLNGVQRIEDQGPCISEDLQPRRRWFSW